MGLAQDPHRTGPDRERSLELAIGKEVKALRLSRGVTVKDLSERTGLSPGMLSKIENGMTSPSLTTLQALSDGLSVPLTTFFRRYEERRAAVHTKAGQGANVDRAGTRAGHQYNLLGHIGQNAAGLVTEPYLITLSAESDTFPTFQHDGLEFLYIFEGAMDYRHGERLYRLEPGDSFFFDADAPHGPEALVTLPVRFLSVISYRSGE